VPRVRRTVALLIAAALVSGVSVVCAGPAAMPCCDVRTVSVPVPTPCCAALGSTPPIVDPTAAPLAATSLPVALSAVVPLEALTRAIAVPVAATSRAARRPVASVLRI
jgi:hypothetical protein